MHERPHGMRPLTQLLPADAALARILAAVRPVTEPEGADLVQTVGRVLAEEVRAPFDVPAFDRAAMDGYALRAADAQQPAARLRIVGRVDAGDVPHVRVGPGECVQIATGAPLAAGTDAVVPVERTRTEGDRVVLERAVRLGEHVSYRASDLARDTRVLAEGVVLTPARIAVAAATGRARLSVWRRPRVSILSTGSELRAPGSPLKPGEIYDSNGPALAALFRAQGAEVVVSRRVEDHADALAKALSEAAGGADLVVASGASSAGERDLLRDAVAAQGAVEFHGVRVKPGKPLLLGRVGVTPVIGLPGYPTSCLSDAYLFVLPALRRIARMPEEPARRVRARLGTKVESVPDRLWFVPVRLEAGLAVPTYKESGATTSLSDAVGYVAVPPDVPFLDQGEAVDVVLF